MSSEEVSSSDSQNPASQTDAGKSTPTSASGGAGSVPASHEFAARMRGAWQGAFVLFVVVCVVLLGTGYFGYSKFGMPGVITAGVAGLVCFAAATAALIVTALTANTPNALSGILLGIVLRTAVPLLLTILLMQAFKPLADTGLMGMVLINYLAVLAAETLLAVRIVQANSSTVVQQ